MQKSFISVRGALRHLSVVRRSDQRRRRADPFFGGSLWKDTQGRRILSHAAGVRARIGTTMEQ